MEKYNKKEIIPGYTGHIPFKQDTFAITAGLVNKQLVAKTDTISAGASNERKYFNEEANNINEKGADRLKLGNRSSYGPTWIGGPTHMLYAQHVPGYQGYVSGIYSENLFGKSYAKTTQKAIKQNYPKGFDINSEAKYKSYYESAFNENKNRRIKADVALKGIKKDEIDFDKLGGLSTSQANDAILAKSNSCFFGNSRSKSTLLDAFKDKQADNLDGRFGNVTSKDKKGIKIPCLGYQGFMKGLVSQNFHGKPFRECAVQSVNMKVMTSL